MAWVLESGTHKSVLRLCLFVTQWSWCTLAFSPVSWSWKESYDWLENQMSRPNASLLLTSTTDGLENVKELLSRGDTVLAHERSVREVFAFLNKSHDIPGAPPLPAFNTDMVPCKPGTNRNISDTLCCSIKCRRENMLTVFLLVIDFFPLQASHSSRIYITFPVLFPPVFQFFTPDWLVSGNF